MHARVVLGVGKGVLFREVSSVQGCPHREREVSSFHCCPYRGVHRIVSYWRYIICVYCLYETLSLSLSPCRSRLVLSESLGHHNPSSPYRRPPSMVLHHGRPPSLMQRQSSNNVLPFNQETSELLETARSDIVRLKLRKDRKVLCICVPIHYISIKYYIIQ